MPKGNKTKNTTEVWTENGKFKTKYLNLTPTASLNFGEKDKPELIIESDDFKNGIPIRVPSTMIGKIKSEWEKANQLENEK